MSDEVAVRVGWFAQVFGFSPVETHNKTRADKHTDKTNALLCYVPHLNLGRESFLFEVFDIQLLVSGQEGSF